MKCAMGWSTCSTISSIFIDSSCVATSVLAAVSYSFHLFCTFEPCVKIQTQLETCIYFGGRQPEVAVNTNDICWMSRTFFLNLERSAFRIFHSVLERGIATPEMSRFIFKIQ